MVRDSVVVSVRCVSFGRLGIQIFARAEIWFEFTAPSVSLANSAITSTMIVRYWWEGETATRPHPRLRKWSRRILSSTSKVQLASSAASPINGNTFQWRHRFCCCFSLVPDSAVTITRTTMDLRLDPRKAQSIFRCNSNYENSRKVVILHCSVIQNRIALLYWRYLIRHDDVYF